MIWLYINILSPYEPCFEENCQAILPFKCTTVNEYSGVHYQIQRGYQWVDWSTLTCGNISIYGVRKTYVLTKNILHELKRNN